MLRKAQPVRITGHSEFCIRKIDAEQIAAESSSCDYRPETVDFKAIFETLLYAED